MTLDERIFKVAQKIVENPYFMGAFMGFFFAYIIYRGIA